MHKLHIAHSMRSMRDVCCIAMERWMRDAVLCAGQEAAAAAAHQHSPHPEGKWVSGPNKLYGKGALKKRRNAAHSLC